MIIFAGPESIALAMMRAHVCVLMCSVLFIGSVGFLWTIYLSFQTFKPGTGARRASLVGFASAVAAGPSPLPLVGEGDRVRQQQEEAQPLRKPNASPPPEAARSST
jgi:hypothetical protein